MTFKRTHTTFNGGDVPRHSGASASTDFVPKQQVKIIRCHDADEDYWLVETANGTRHIVEGDDLSPHPTDPELNTEFVERLMTMDSPLMQPFILQAIEQFAKAVLQAPALSPEEDAGMVSDAAWRRCAQYTLGNFVARDEESRMRNERFAKQNA